MFREYDDDQVTTSGSDQSELDDLELSSSSRRISAPFNVRKENVMEDVLFSPSQPSCWSTRCTLGGALRCGATTLKVFGVLMVLATIAILVMTVGVLLESDQEAAQTSYKLQREEYALEKRVEIDENLLKQSLGEEAYRQAEKDYVLKHRKSNYTFEDMQNEIESLTN